MKGQVSAFYLLFKMLWWIAARVVILSGDKWPSKEWTEIRDAADYILEINDSELRV